MSSLLGKEEYLYICRQAYMYKMTPGEDKTLQFYLKQVKLAETKRSLISSKEMLADHLNHLLVGHRRYSVQKGLVSSSKAYRRKRFYKGARAFIKELRRI